MTPVAIVSASRLRIEGWDARGLWLVDLDSPRRFLVEAEGAAGAAIVETAEPAPAGVGMPEDDPVVPAGVPHGWTVRWGERWAVLVSDKLILGRGDRREAVVHLARSSDKIRAYPPGVVIAIDGSEHAFPWDSFGAAEIFAAPLRIELAAAVQRRVRVLQAGATILRVEILDPAPGWRATATIASRGNPLGFAVGDAAVATGNEVAGELAIASVSREAGAAAATSLTRGEPVRVARGRVAKPAWIAALVRAGWLDDEAAVPEELWCGTPVEALAHVHEPRGALDRGFAWYRLNIARSTARPLADFAQMAGAPPGTLAGLRVPPAEDLGGTFGEVLAAVNARLAERGVARRLYELETGGTWYAFAAATDAELAVLEAAGIAPLR